MSDIWERKLGYFGLTIVAVAAGGLLLTTGQANAAGCNGHVEPQTWGCAPWDNNNGPKFPHYKAPAHPAPVHHAAPAAPALRAPPAPVHHASPSHPRPQAPTAQLPGHQQPQGNGVVSQGAGNILGNSSSGVVSQGAGNLIGHDGASMRR